MPDDDDATRQRVRRRGYRFATVPEWVLYHPDLSDRAVRLFAVLDRYAGADGECYPSLRTLADRLGVSKDTVRRAKAELVTAGALVEAPRFVDGRQVPNDLVLIGDPEGGVAPALGGGSGAATGGVAGPRPQEREPLNEKPSPPPAVTPAGPSTSTSWRGEVLNRYGRIIAQRDGAQRPDAYARRVASNAAADPVIMEALAGLGHLDAAAAAEALAGPVVRPGSLVDVKPLGVSGCPVCEGSGWAYTDGGVVDCECRAGGEVVLPVVDVDTGGRT